MIVVQKTYKKHMDILEWIYKCAMGFGLSTYKSIAMWYPRRSDFYM